MPELHLKRTGDTLTVTFAEHSKSVPWTDVALKKDTGQRIYEDAGDYGRTLFGQVFGDESLRSPLQALRSNERVVLVAEQPEVAVIPWEYLRDPNNTLLASRLNLVRGVPEGQRRGQVSVKGPLKIVAVPVSPVDESRVLNTEREWRRLVETVTGKTPEEAPGKVLTLTRVRPPTLAQMEQTLPGQGISVISFMGHSGINKGKSVLVFEDQLGRSQPIDAAYFADALDESVFLVVLNSCLSAVGTATEFGNIAQALVHQGVPYALGMQFVLLDDAALEMSKTLYTFLLQGRSVEEAVRRTRRMLENNATLHRPLWVAGIPVLYTNQREPALPIVLETGQPTIQPDPERLQNTCDLTALPQAEHFVGRGPETSAALEILLAPAARGFVLLHGLGGIGKTALAHVIAERVSWHYTDCVLTYSFETFATVDAEQRIVVSETFADRFYNRLARFYGIDPADQNYQTTPALQQAILQRRTRTRSLLVLDNLETLIDALKRGDETVKAAATPIATFISRLKEGDGAILLTSRSRAPVDWGDCAVIPLSGLSEEAGAELFLSLLPEDHRHLAPPNDRLALTRRVRGHPLSIRLLAGRFASLKTDLATFLAHIETELAEAEQTAPSTLEDFERQKTLYACIDYSFKRLTPEQQKVLHTVSMFLAPFIPEFAQFMLNDEEQTPVHLQQLVHLGLLEYKTRTFPEGTLEFFELHPTVRWYLQHRLPTVEPEIQERYGLVYEDLARRAYQPEGGADQSAWMRYLVRQSLSDCEAAFQYLQPAASSALAYHLAEPYQRMGQVRRALKLYEQALEIYQALGDVRGISVTQNAMANLLSQLGRPQEAMALYEQSLRTKQELGDVRSISVTQNAMADLLRQLGRPQEAMALYEQSLRTKQELGDVQGIAVVEANFALLLFQQGQYQRALSMAWHSYTSLRERNYTRDVQGVQGILVSLKRRFPEQAQFDGLWEQTIHEPQPDWLREVQAGSVSKQGRISQEQLDVIVANTVAVMTEVEEKRSEWRETIARALQQVQASNRQQDAAFFAAILAILDGQEPSLSEENPYADTFAEILAGVAASAQGEQASVEISDEVIQAVREFVNARNWEATRQVVEARQALLFEPEAEAVFEAFIAQAKAAKDERTAELLEMHLAVLQACKMRGIAQTFEQLAIGQHSVVDEELIVRSIRALLGSPQEKMAHAQYLAMQAAQTNDEGLKALIEVIQLALFGGEIGKLGGSLQGAYQEAWRAIVEGVEAEGK